MNPKDVECAECSKTHIPESCLEYRGKLTCKTCLSQKPCHQCNDELGLNPKWIEGYVICEKCWTSREKNEGGQKFDVGKLRLDLLPILPMQGTAQVLTYGAVKYKDRNWEVGIKYSRVYGAMQRHIMAWWAGEQLDPDTGLHHLHHASCCMMFLQEYEMRREKFRDFDDRPYTHPEKSDEES